MTAFTAPIVVLDDERNHEQIGVVIATDEGATVMVRAVKVLRPNGDVVDLGAMTNEVSELTSSLGGIETTKATAERIVRSYKLGLGQWVAEN